MPSLKDRTTITRKAKDAVLAEVVDAVGQTVGAMGGFAGLVTEYQTAQVSIKQAHGLVWVQLSVRADKHSTQILAVIQSIVLGIDGFTARGNNFDVPSFTDMTTEELAGKINEAIDGLDFDAIVSFGDAQSELVEKANYGEHIPGLRPGAGSEVLARVQRAHYRAREIVA